MNSKRLYWFANVVVFVVVIIIGSISFSLFRESVETDASVIRSLKLQYINVNGIVKNIIGQREMNEILKLNNGYLISPQEEMADIEIKTYADEVIKYADFCKSQGKPFLFVQPILNVDEDNKQLPIGAEDYSNENINVFLQYLREADIDVLDIRECMKTEGMNLYDYTYITDHHWTTEGSFYAFTQITDWIERETGVVVDSNVTNLDNYEIETYKNWYLGSYGKRVGKYFAGMDDYRLVIPKFDVTFVDEEGKSHSFYDQIVNNRMFESGDTTSRYIYEFALKEPVGIATTSRDLSVLFVSDSYATAMAPYLKLAYCDYYFQHYEKGFSADYVLQTNPDVVVLMPFNSNSLNDSPIYHEATVQ